MTESSRPFWETKSLEEMTKSEWESLCDHCGKCCLYKFEDEDSGEIYFTDVVCKFIDLETCSCSQYSQRSSLVPDCLDLKSPSFTQYHWLPSTCAYRLLAEGETLPDWHPLRTGDPNSVHRAGISVRHFALIEQEDMILTDHIQEGLS